MNNSKGLQSCTYPKVSGVGMSMRISPAISHSLQQVRNIRDKKDGPIFCGVGIGDLVRDSSRALPVHAIELPVARGTI